MSVRISIRNVPETVRNELAARAAREGTSMQQYLLEQLEALARRPTASQWVAEARELKAKHGTNVAPETLLEHRDDDRR